MWSLQAYRQATDLVQEGLCHAQRLVFLQASGLDLLRSHAVEVAMDGQQDPVQIQRLQGRQHSSVSSSQGFWIDGCGNLSVQE